MRKYIEENKGKECKIEYIECPDWDRSPVVSCAGIMVPRYGESGEIIGITIKIEKTNTSSIERPIRLNQLKMVRTVM